MILVIDNYDSFTYNLVQYIGEVNPNLIVRRNDRIGIREVGDLQPSHIVISPGPGTPDQAGVSLSLIERFAGHIPILGVCLGHQAIGQAFGGRIVHAPVLMHGKTSPVFHDGSGLHRDLPSPFTATRYHSLVIDPTSVPHALRVNAWTEEGDVMSVEHRSLAVYGVQYHPESIMTTLGAAVVRAFLTVDRRASEVSPIEHIRTNGALSVASPAEDPR